MWGQRWISDGSLSLNLLFVCLRCCCVSLWHLVAAVQTKWSRLTVFVSFGCCQWSARSSCDCCWSVPDLLWTDDTICLSLAHPFVSGADTLCPIRYTLRLDRREFIFETWPSRHFSPRLTLIWWMQGWNRNREKLLQGCVGEVARPPFNQTGWRDNWPSGWLVYRLTVDLLTDWLTSRLVGWRKQKSREAPSPHRTPEATPSLLDKTTETNNADITTKFQSHHISCFVVSW